MNRRRTKRTERKKKKTPNTLDEKAYLERTEKHERATARYHIVWQAGKGDFASRPPQLLRKREKKTSTALKGGTVGGGGGRQRYLRCSEDKR